MQAVQEIVESAIAATDDDWSTEYLDAIVSIRVVQDIDAAIEHIAQYGSGHTESIITDDYSSWPSIFFELSTVQLFCTMRRRSMPTGASSAWALKLVSQQGEYTHAVPLVQNN